MNQDMIVVAAFTSVHEAQLARTALQAAGIQTALQNEHIVSMNWMYSNLVGGVKLIVERERADEARAVLATAATVEEDANTDLPAESAEDTCDRCGSRDFDSVPRGKGFSIFTWLTIGVPLGPAARRRFCRRCGAPARG